MQYEFTTDKVGAIKLQYFDGTSKTLRLEGVDAQISDANIIISGVNQLLSVVNFQNRYNPEYVVRVVNQNVVVQQ